MYRHSAKGKTTGTENRAVLVFNELYLQACEPCAWG
jgi:hypothetical protein